MVATLTDNDIPRYAVFFPTAERDAYAAGLGNGHLPLPWASTGTAVLGSDYILLVSQGPGLKLCPRWGASPRQGRSAHLTSSANAEGGVWAGSQAHLASHTTSSYSSYPYSSPGQRSGGETT